MEPGPEPRKPPTGKELAALTLSAIGVVFGDIGTSPLYAIKESFHPSHGLALSTENVFGILSLVFWSLTFVICIKYLGFILRADNRREGGIIALLGLLVPRFENSSDRRQRLGVIVLGLLGAGLLYGDGIITPAISVLSAVEGLEMATPAFQPMVVPLTIAILIGLFSVQKRGTAIIGKIFGPVTVVWFLTLASTGLPWLLERPEILAAVNPVHAFRFFSANGIIGFLVLSSVVLCITGCEALYADMGHFGKRPIQVGWFSLVFPCLLINYFGQGALILERGQAAIANTFYGLVSGWLLYPLSFIAILATAIASQALISGAFSLTQQTVQLGYLPRTTIRHTSRETEGHVVVPKVNLLLMLACIVLVLSFQKSTNLAAAYGIAVTGTMVITSLLFYQVTRRSWRWRKAPALLLLLLFLAVDISFFSANAVKLLSGGWIPVLIAVTLLIAMMTWKQGRLAVSQQLQSKATPLGEFMKRIEMENPHRVEGTAVFMTLNQDVAPSVLLHHYTHNRSLHQRVLLLSILTEHQPSVPATERVRVTDLDHGFVKVVARYGYMESPDVPEILTACEGSGLVLDQRKVSFYLGRESFSLTGTSRMAHWRKKLFVFLSRNARSASEYFKLSPDQVIEIGSQIRL